MTAPARTPRAAARVRLAVLAALAIGHLPLPVVHSHAATAAGSPRLARHLALFHAGGSAESTRSHVHLVPAAFFAGGGLGDATGDDAPDPGTREVPPLQVAQLDAPDAAPQTAVVLEPAAPVAPSAGGPAHFLATFSASRDLGGLLGVCRC